MCTDLTPLKFFTLLLPKKHTISKSWNQMWQFYMARRVVIDCILNAVLANELVFIISFKWTRTSHSISIMAPPKLTSTFSLYSFSPQFRSSQEKSSKAKTARSDATAAMHQIARSGITFSNTFINTIARYRLTTETTFFAVTT